MGRCYKNQEVKLQSTIWFISKWEVGMPGTKNKVDMDSWRERKSDYTLDVE